MCFKGCWVDFNGAIKSGTSELWTKGSECPCYCQANPKRLRRCFPEATSLSMYAKYQQYATNNFIDANVMVDGARALIATSALL